MKSLLKFLGLDENATEEQAIAALRARDARFAEREQAVGYLDFASHCPTRQSSISARTADPTTTTTRQSISPHHLVMASIQRG
jgi:hypothetical protein